jgi:hypothetical protein
MNFHPLSKELVTRVMWCEPMFQTVSIRVGFLHEKKFEAGKTMDSGWCHASIPFH